MTVILYCVVHVMLATLFQLRVAICVVFVGNETCFINRGSTISLDHSQS